MLPDEFVGQYMNGVVAADFTRGAPPVRNDFLRAAAGEKTPEDTSCHLIAHVFFQHLALCPVLRCGT